MLMPTKTAIAHESVIDRYLSAKEFLVDSGYAREIDWQEDLCFGELTQTTFLKESAWVVLSSGMRESVVRDKFPAISTAFHDWTNPRAIVQTGNQCQQAALAVFGHRSKIRSIFDICRLTAEAGFDFIVTELSTNGIQFLQSLPFIGPVTSFHLAKNLGMDVVKPDRHLCRLASALSYDSPLQMCDTIANAVGDRLAVVDLVLWRFATVCRDYCEFFSGGEDDRHASEYRRSSVTHSR
jgi:hypothetical protein